jgi:predicted RNase H-like HicB family nuclease
MQYTLILTEKTDGGIQVMSPALPACTIEAATRDEAIRLAREAIAQLVSHSEIIQIDIPQQPWVIVQPRGKPRHNFLSAGGELTRPCRVDTSSASPQGRTAAGESSRCIRVMVFKSKGLHGAGKVG